MFESGEQHDPSVDAQGDAAVAGGGAETAARRGRQPEPVFRGRLVHPKVRTTLGLQALS